MGAVNRLPFFVIVQMPKTETCQSETTAFIFRNSEIHFHLKSKRTEFMDETRIMHECKPLSKLRFLYEAHIQNREEVKTGIVLN